MEASFFDQYNLKNLANLELLARQVVEGFIIGLHRSPFHGFSVEFAEHRIYNQGEPTKNIDWKVFARTDRLYSKRYEEETNLRCQLVIDCSGSMYYPEGHIGGTQMMNKLGFSALAAASLMNLLKKQRDAFGLSLFSDHLEIHTRAKGSTSHYRLLLHQLEQRITQPKLGEDTNTAAVLHEIAERIHRRSLVILFSDMFEQADTDELFDALLHLKHSKHEVILFHVVEKNKELLFDFESRPYLFEDTESGQKIRLNPKDVKQAYLKKVTERTERIKLECLHHRIDYYEADIRAGYTDILNRFLIKRSRMNI